MSEGHIAYYRAISNQPRAALNRNPLAFLWTRGNTPLHWQGLGAGRLGFDGTLTRRDFNMAFARGGLRDPATGRPLVRIRRRGFVLYVVPDKSVALLGAIGRWNDALAITEAETTATMGYLDDWVQRVGGRRGRMAAVTPTSGLVYAVSRHVASAAGDPLVHDHVVVANAVEMLDPVGGYKALHSGGLRDKLEAATMVGRQAAAACAVELGYAIEADGGASGRRRGWRLAGVPRRACDLFSKRRAAIEEHLAPTTYTSYRARTVAARATTPPTSRKGVSSLLGRWHDELRSAGWPRERLLDHLDRAEHRRAALPGPLSRSEVEALGALLLHPGAAAIGSEGYFTPSRLVAELTAHLYGHRPDELHRVMTYLLASPQAEALGKNTAAGESMYRWVGLPADRSLTSDMT